MSNRTCIRKLAGLFVAVGLWPTFAAANTLPGEAPMPDAAAITFDVRRAPRFLDLASWRAPEVLRGLGARLEAAVRRRDRLDAFRVEHATWVAVGGREALRIQSAHAAGDSRYEQVQYLIPGAAGFVVTVTAPQGGIDGGEPLVKEFLSSVKTGPPPALLDAAPFFLVVALVAAAASALRVACAIGCRRGWVLTHARASQSY